MDTLEKFDLAVLAMSQRQFEEAARHLQDIIEIDPNNVVAHYGLAQILLTLGQYERGFSEFEWRWKLNSPLSQWYWSIYDPNKLWNGEPLYDKTLMIFCDQGFGDAIHFCRYIKQAKERVHGKVIVHAQAPLASLLEEEVVVVADIGTRDHEKFPPYDYVCPAMSLPFVLKDFQPRGEPYLSCEKKHIAGDKKKIGIIWGGRPGNIIDQEVGRNRSIPICHFRKLQSSKTHLFRLQTEKRPDLGDAGWLIDLTPYIRNMKDTAEIMQGLDLIISCDTAAAHLAGALGRPCWLLLPYLACWRWGLRDTTPWYNSIRIFRQQKPDEWEPVLEKVAHELAISPLP